MMRRLSEPRRRRWLRWIGAPLLGLILLAGLGFVAWASTPLGPAPTALAALQSSTDVAIDRGNWLEFRPANQTPTTGFIFYPGGRVDFRAYAPIAHELASQGFLVVIPPMPLSLAVFTPDAADAIIAAHPEIANWAIGGHSLGGAMAARYALTHPGAVQGLVLWASYPAETDDLSRTNLRVTSIYGTQDAVAARDAIAASRARLPASTTWVVIEGGNHAQFGAYGSQPGDGAAAISAEEQWRQTIAATSILLQVMSDEVMK